MRHNVATTIMASCPKTHLICVAAIGWTLVITNILFQNSLLCNDVLTICRRSTNSIFKNREQTISLVRPGGAASGGIHVNMTRFPDKYIFFGLNLEELKKDAINGTVGEYLPDYKNPCWLSKTRRMDSKATPDGARLRCLPYFYIVGVAKCGTNDVTNMLAQHPELYPCSAHEPMYWNRRRKYRDMSLSSYMDLFEPSLRSLANSSTLLSDGVGVHQGLIFETSPNYLWAFNEWNLWPETKDLPVPPYTAADIIYRVTPEARIIILVRDPVDRLYSHYNHFAAKNSTPSDFHIRVTLAVSDMNSCLLRHDPRTCIYVPSKAGERKPVFLRAGMYASFIKDWMKVFPRRQIFILRSEDYYANRTQPMRDILTFLGVDTPLPPSAFHLPPQNSRTYRPMMKETRQILRQFYAPHNRLMAELLSDNRFLWSNSSGVGFMNN